MRRFWDHLRKERGCERFKSLRRVEKRWEEVRRGEKRREELWRCGKRWEELSWGGNRNKNLRRVEKSCEKNWEELRWPEKSCEELRSGGHSWKGVRQDEDKFTEQSFEDVRLHSNSYRQNLSFTPIVQHSFLSTGNFRHPPCAGFTCICNTLKKIGICNVSNNKDVMGIIKVIPYGYNGM